MEGLFFDKTHDESKQGEAVAAAPGDMVYHKHFYIESYGCAMNFSDSEIVASIMTDMGYETTRTMEEADVIFLNTCSIRDNAEQRVWQRIREIKKGKKKNDVRRRRRFAASRI